MPDLATKYADALDNIFRDLGPEVQSCDRSLALNTPEYTAWQIQCEVSHLRDGVNETRDDEALARTIDAIDEQVERLQQIRATAVRKRVELASDRLPLVAA